MIVKDTDAEQNKQEATRAEETGQSFPEQYGNLQKWEYDQLTRQHGKLTCVVVDEDGPDPIWFWFKKPTIAVLSAASKFMESDPVQAAMIMFKNCLVKGDAAQAEDVEVFAPVMEQLQTIVKKEERYHKKLLTRTAFSGRTDGAEELRQGNALIRFYYKIDPGTLDDEEWCESVNGIFWNLEQIRKMITGKD